jgi:hypothetical protein
MRTGASEPRARESRTFAALVPQSGIDYGMWSSCRTTRACSRYARLWAAGISAIAAAHIGRSVQQSELRSVF